MFTRRHYRIIALTFADLLARTHCERSRAMLTATVIPTMADTLTHDNPRFNRAAFYRACGMEAC